MDHSMTMVTGCRDCHHRLALWIASRRATGRLVKPDWSLRILCRIGDRHRANDLIVRAFTQLDGGINPALSARRKRWNHSARRHCDGRHKM